MPKRPALVPVPAVSAPPWKGLLRRSSSGAAFADVRNALIVLRHEMAFAHCFAFDEMQQAAMLLAKPPICADALDGPDPPRPVTPEDVTRLAEWLQHNAMPKLGREHVEYALELVARERLIHPLRTSLELSQWDGVRRMEGFLVNALGCPDDEYHWQIGPMFLIAMVKRIMEPGCQADYMLVLEGPQGELKSRFCRELVGDAYFSDALPRLDTDRVRVSMHLRGKWLIEISELSAFSRSEAGALKAFITQREEIYTPKYGRKERREPRQCLFIGTTNDDEYIRDDTGGRRFWPVKVGKVDLEWLRENREQLFAEAVVGWQDGRPHWPNPDFEREVIAPRQAEKQVFDHWTNRVIEAAERTPHETPITIAGIWNSIAGTSDVKQLDMMAQKRIAAILRNAEYRKIRSHRSGYVWQKTE